MPSVIATIQAKADKVEEMKKALAAMCKAVLESESGTLAYIAHQRQDDPTKFVFYEKYESDAAFAEHGKNLAKNGAGLAGLVAGPPEVLRLDEI